MRYPISPVLGIPGPRVLPAVLLGCAALLGCINKSSVGTMVAELPRISQGQPKPAWQQKLNAQETDFIQALDRDRVLVGTLEMTGLNWGALTPKELRAVNPATGETLWVASRQTLGFPQTLVATFPVILLEGPAKLAAFSPQTGALLWERPKAGARWTFLPDCAHMAVFSMAQSQVTVTRVNLLDGAETWTATVATEAPMTVGQLAVKAVGGTLLLVGQGCAGLAEDSGRILWKAPFPGPAQPPAEAIVQDGDLFFTNGAWLRKCAPASGAVLWEGDYKDRPIRSLAVHGRKLYALSRDAAEAPDTLLALDRDTGRWLWSCPLPGQVSSPLAPGENRVCLTVADALVAVDDQRGAIAFRAALPGSLQGRNLLPDNVCVVGGRVVVARESGVAAFDPSTGRILLAEPVGDGVIYTHDFAVHRRAYAHLGAAGAKARAQSDLRSRPAVTANFYRTALDNEKLVYASTATALRSGSNMERNLALTQRSIALKQARSASRLDSAIQLSNAITGLANAFAGVVIALDQANHEGIMEAQEVQALAVHASELQGNFYIRPRYHKDRGWSLLMVDLLTGARTDLVLSPYNRPLSSAGANLPAFALDPGGTRIISKGLGLDSSRYEVYKRGTNMAYWEVPWPSLLAFDVGALNFSREVQDAPPAPPGPAPGRKALNDKLVEAAFQGELATVKQMLDAGADVDAVDEYGQTGLMLAAESLKSHGKDDVIKLLLERGADSAIMDPGGWTAFDYYVALGFDARAHGVAKGMVLLLKAQKAKDIY